MFGRRKNTNPDTDTTARQEAPKLRQRGTIHLPEEPYKLRLGFPVTRDPRKKNR
ncbi:hypothetical protein GCM10027160_23660 [Streptomyces calidiresistens]|uniref:Uncharacterized protein n=1 Tax=Streptomyces calidiresistens TaxID=1485586 RepID=A0A7W3T940_9ACTN|nr:hypothetical protein [Streptomyces calidiresistens]MBB0233011.1 hypothetical protein [Streptomyces calidiresistens]